MPVYEDPIGGLRLDAGALLRWTTNLVERLGAPGDIAADVAEVLIASDLRGIASHGTARLPQYVKLAQAQVLHVRNAPSPAATASLAIGRELAEMAIERFGI
jgi:LDH2 family malate/lactate/ureidoglycolate dehydrogenase